MPCHTAVVSINDSISILTLIVFLAGLLMGAVVWFSGSVSDQSVVNPFQKVLVLLAGASKTVFSGKILPVVKSLFFDVFLQQRLFQRSAKRWLIHSLIFFPFVFRFLWGIASRIASSQFPREPQVWFMLDKNHPFSAFLFDLTGVMILLGIVFAFLRGSFERQKKIAGLPDQDRWALGLIGGVVVAGFFLEGLRIAMAGWPPDSIYAFLGYGISRIFSNPIELTAVYGYIWYLHAVLTGAFFAYLPFSRLTHMIIAPIVLAMNAVSDHKH
ncbi:respiratory nitrate reductase subunit gamma [Thermodesulfobacteriota bacterium]